jgi:hypothetical protein
MVKIPKFLDIGFLTKKTNLFYFLLIIQFICPLNSIGLTKVYEENGEIEFAKIFELKVNIKDLVEKSGMTSSMNMNMIKHSFFSISANITTGVDCSKKSTVK